MTWFLYKENPKISSHTEKKKTIGNIKFSKGTGFKINIQQPTWFYTLAKSKSANEILKSNPIYISIINSRTLRNKLHKESIRLA